MGSVRSRLNLYNIVTVLAPVLLLSYVNLLRDISTTQKRLILFAFFLFTLYTGSYRVFAVPNTLNCTELQINYQLGIDISDDLLTAVLLSGKGREQRLENCASTLLKDCDALAEVLPGLLEELNWQGGDVVYGLPLSCFSLRNLVLPFSDDKAVRQVLPLELEEHLLVPVDEQITATTEITKGDAGTHLLVAAMEKKLLGDHLDILRGQGIEPEIVCPASYVLTEQLAATQGKEEDFLFLYGDLGSMTMSICHQGKVVFIRRLSYPEQVFHDALFSFNGTSISQRDPEAADQAVVTLCQDVQRSIDLFCLHFVESLPLKLELAVVAGPMQILPGFQENIEQTLSIPCHPCDLRQTIFMETDLDIDDWQPALFDRALALALLAREKGKKYPFNFRKQEFAPVRPLFGSKKQALTLALAAGFVFFFLIGYLFIDFQYLNKRNEGLAGQMEKIFQQSFPEARNTREPLLQMRSRLQEVERSPVSMPIFTQDKRVLVILADISSRIPANITVHVSRLIIDQDSVRIKGTTDAFNNVNSMKKLLTASGQYAEVSIVSATKGKGKEGIRFEIRIQLAAGEAS